MPIDTSTIFETVHAADPAAEYGAAGPVAVPYDAGLAPGVPLPVAAEALLREYDAKGEAGEIVEVPVPRGDGVGRVLLYGVGDRGPRALRKAAAGLARRARGREELTITLPDAAADAWSALAEGALLASYAFRILGSGGSTPGTGEGRAKPAGRIRFVGPQAAGEPVRRGEVTARATALNRDLANTPSSIKSPAWLADRAVEIAREAGLDAEVWDAEKLEADGFGGILAVGRGSAYPPRLIKLEYRPKDAPADGGHRHVVLVGKGITFDSGGLSLKPNDNMKFQKTDMAGGGAVIAVMSALAELGCRARVTGLIAAAENMPSGGAQRPGDVITHFGGRTVEVLNTDAEGRLVLADALAYADARLDPDVIVDVATLTGAIGIGLGREYGAVFASSDEVAADLVRAGESSGDRVWRMPLVEDYRPALDSTVADLANIDTGGEFGAGSITAALFLREFTGGRPWAHLDIAAVGRTTSDEGIHSKGSTGYGVRLLLDYLTRS
ncbi:leucyl aminopeptidase [Thermopolyspora sp. NPDC052614]|uniref:leucyl aminopeptidase n=1 Tax=Thermopolyspora sp. NPDC052614 TaxID=3155682 RepID=UPI0034197BCF